MKDDELVALFIGMQKTNIGWYDNEGVLSNLRDNTFDYLEFQTSWDWLMPVTIKIQKLGFNLEIDTRTSLLWQQIDGNGKVTIYKEKAKTISGMEDRDSKLEMECSIITSFSNKNPEEMQKALFAAVVGFIKWYNKENDADV